MSLTKHQREALFHYCLRLGDDHLILGHRLSELCGKGPFLEEDIALSNISLDSTGAASLFLKLAGEIEGEGRSADDLAFFRDEWQFENAELVEQENTDFAYVIVRQFLFDSYITLLLTELTKSPRKKLSEIAAKTLKEATYHLRHSSTWIIRLGDGTKESHQRVKEALDFLWTYTDELFEVDDKEARLIKAGLVPDKAELKSDWLKIVRDTLLQARLELPSSDRYMASGARWGQHSECLGILLAEMQSLARAHPGAVW